MSGEHSKDHERREESVKKTAHTAHNLLSTNNASSV